MRVSREGLTLLECHFLRVWFEGKRQIIRRSLKSTPPIMSGVVSSIHPEGYLTMA